VTDLAEFVAARLDEDEAAARARKGVFPSPGVEDSGAVWLHVKRGGNAVVAHYLHPVEGDGDMADLQAWADADRGWTPNRVLREVEAKRKILAEHGREDVGWIKGRDLRCTACGGYGIYPGVGDRGYQKSWPCPTLRALAEAYCDHPDYQEWK
jgi:hypothetical protein